MIVSFVALRDYNDVRIEEDLGVADGGLRLQNHIHDAQRILNMHIQPSFTAVSLSLERLVHVIPLARQKDEQCEPW